MSASTPVLAWIAELLTAQVIKYSTAITASVNITSGWEVQIPVYMKFSNVTADAIVDFYPTYDGGVSFDTSPMASFAIPFLANSICRASVRVPTGQYLIAVRNNSHNSATVWIQTSIVVTAVNNV